MKYTIEQIHQLSKDKGWIQQEQMYQERLDEIVQRIFDSGKKLILLCGPSGAGKTTTALKLEETIQKKGVNVQHIAMDDYFHSLTENEKQLLNEGTLNVETPDRVNAMLLAKQLQDLLSLKEVPEYHFDFKTSTCMKLENTLQIQENDFVIVEGIHVFNPAVLDGLDAYKLFVYPADVVEAKQTRIADSQIRLLRRMIRNALYRGHDIQKTCMIYPILTESERLYIFPYQHLADDVMNTFIPYELQVYKSLVFTQLQQYKQDDAIVKLIQILDKIEEISVEEVISSSLIREFIGDSNYHY